MDKRQKIRFDDLQLAFANLAIAARQASYTLSSSIKSGVLSNFVMYQINRAIDEDEQNLKEEAINAKGYK